MKILGLELNGGVDSSAHEFRDDLIQELEKCIEEPHSMNEWGLSRQIAQQELLKEIIKYLKWSI
ncbi:MAG: hypothetical protein WD512_19660 [Candidatus Paceibacterota bacterium]